MPLFKISRIFPLPSSFFHQFRKANIRQIVQEITCDVVAVVVSVAVDIGKEFMYSV